MRRFIFLAFIGAFLMAVHGYRSSPVWLYGENSKLNKTKEETQTVCQTQECKEMAKLILDNMNKSADPCDDFYEYACGEYPIHNPLPEELLIWDVSYSLQMKVQQQIKEILNTGPEDSDLFAVKLGKRWYKSCMNTDAMENQGLDPLVSTISRIGGWPMIMDPDEWDEDEYSWQKVDDQYMRLTGKNAFHDVSVNEYWKKVKINVPDLPENSYKFFKLFYLLTEMSDEDLNDEEDESDEKGKAPGSESEDDSKDGENDSNDDDHGNNKDENSDNEISYDDKQDNDKAAKKKIIKKKTAGKINHKKNRKLGHTNRHKNNDARITKKDNSRKAKQGIKRRATIKNKSTKVNDKYMQYSIHREKLHARKSKGNNAKNVHRQKRKKSMNNESTYTSTRSRVITEETEEEDEMELFKPYSDYISKVARAIAKARGIEVSEENIEKDIEDMIKFQIKLVYIMENIDDPGARLKLTLKDFQEWYDENNSETNHSKIDWIYKIKEVFEEAHVPVNDDLNLKIFSPDYFEALVSLLDETPSRTIVNYVHWNFISGIIKTTTSEMREMYNEWTKADDDDERSDVCMKEIQMNDILAYEYVRRHFSDDVIQTAMDMYDDVQKEVEYQIKKSDWMDDDTKDFVLSKLVKMRKIIGYPNWYTNSTIVKQYFQGLIIGMSYYENTLSYSRYVKWKQLRQLIRVVDEEMEMLSELEIDPLEVNSFYFDEFNLLIITAAELQSPSFAYNRPQAINFGIIGSILGHEINHGFDNERYNYDKNGDETSWLSEMTQAYGKRAECFVKQFNNYSIDKASNKKIKNFGNQTAADNIADTMGLQAAFRAYQRRERECGKQDIVLPGLEDITNDQLFFLSFASVWCEVVDPEYIMYLAKSDEHSTGRLRVIGTVSNSEDFAKAYNCPMNSPMNPEKKCNIWK